MTCVFINDLDIQPALAIELNILFEQLYNQCLRLYCTNPDSRNVLRCKYIYIPPPLLSTDNLSMIYSNSDGFNSDQSCSYVRTKIANNDYEIALTMYLLSRQLMLERFLDNRTVITNARLDGIRNNNLIYHSAIC